MARTVSPTVHHRKQLESLAALVIVGAGLAALLWRLGRPPAFPNAADLRGVVGALNSSSLHDTQTIALGTWIAWALLGYLGMTVALRILLVSIDRATGGSRWARSALRLSHLITIPAIRRVVD